MGASNTQKKSAKLYASPTGNIITTSPTTILPNINNNTILKIKNDDLGDVTSNNIGDFYRGAKIFITGATGFVGKALLEKLLRSCTQLDSIYLLMRPKRGLAVEQRLKELLKNPVFGKIREKTPEYFERVCVIQGDVTQSNLGLSDTDRTFLINNIDVVFHSAASVRFNENLKDAVILNTLGTKRIIELCNDLKKLKSFVHVSTAYSNADKREVDEIVYPPPHDPHSIINCVEALPQDAINLLTEQLVGKHPNTYTLTKAMAEHLVLESSAHLPAAIVRPSIGDYCNVVGLSHAYISVTASWKEPFPGWVDNVCGITGIMMEIGRGAIKSIVCDENLLMDLIPVDIVANTLVTAAWHTSACRSNTMRVYNCISGQINSVSWKEFGELTQQYALEYPSKYVTWYPGFSYRTNRIMHWFCAALFHYAPACLLDVLLYCTKHKPIMLRICKKFSKAAKAGEFFALNEWNFNTSGMKNLIKAVCNAEDGDNFNVDISKENCFNWDPYVKSYMLGIRQYVLKDDINSLPAAKVKLNRLYWLNKAFQALSMYILLRIAIK